MDELEANIHETRVSVPLPYPSPWLVIGRDASVRVYHVVPSEESAFQLELGGETTIEEIECHTPDSSPLE